MKTDLAVACAVALFGLVGAFGGAVRQVAHVVGLVAGLVGARAVGQLLVPLATKQLGLGSFWATAGCSIAAFLALYLAAWLGARSALSWLLPGGERGLADRAGGFLLGGAKAALVTWVVLSALLLAEKPLVARLDGARRELGASRIVSLARRHNLFASRAPFEGLSRVAKAARGRAAGADAEVQSLLADSRVRALLDRPAARTAIESGDGSALSDPQVVDLLADLGISERLARVAGRPEKKPR